MTLVAIAASLAGFYLLYNTSVRADFRRDKVSLWLQRHTLLSRRSGVLVLMGSFAIFVMCCGLGSGILFGFVTLMTTGSLVTLFSPLTIHK
jgi:hypothetical protein